MIPSLRSGWLAGVVAASALASACYSPTLGDGKLACSSDGTCPDGFQCASNGYCFANGAAVAPDAPTGVTAVASVRQAQVSWTAPASDGGSAITSYTVTASPGGQTALIGGATTVTVSGLSNGTAYTFTVVASNAVGNSKPSAPSNSITTVASPGAPTSVVATSMPGSVSLSWAAPADDGGSPVTGYVIQDSLNNGAYSTVSAAFTGTTAVISGLANGGSYTFEVAAINAVGEGGFSAPSAAIVLADVPRPTTITAPLVVSAGETGVIASVPAVAGETYFWTLSGASFTNAHGAAGEVANGVDMITFTVTAAAGQQVALTCLASNSIGQGTAPGSDTISVTGAPSQPTILAAASVTVGDTGIVAKVAASNGMTYNWTLSANATLRGSDLHGVTANGFNSITYDLASSAAAGGHVSLSVVEVNPAQQMSAPGVLSQAIFAAPATPTISAPTMVAASESGASASVPARAGMTYAWTLTGATFSAGSSAAGSSSNGTNSILFDVTAPTGGTVGLSVVEANPAGKSSTPGTASVPVGSLPSPLTIQVALDNGATTPQLQSGATQYASQTATSVLAQVATIPGATYAWTVSGGGAAHAGEMGTAHTFLFDVTGTPGDPTTGTIALACTVSLGADHVAGTQTVTIVALPLTPVVSLDSGGATLSLDANDGNPHIAAVVSPVSTSTYAWSAMPAADLAQLGTSGASVNFTLSAAATQGTSIAINAVETNAAGHAGTAGTGTVSLLAPLAKPVITPSSSAVADNLTYTASLGTPVAGVTYVWSIDELIDGASQGAVVCGAGTPAGPNACVDNGDGTISFTPGNLMVGHTTLVLEVTASDSSGNSISATPVSLDVIALPVATIQFGPSPTGDSFGAMITVGKAREAFVTQSATTYAWSIGAPGNIVSGGATDDVVFNGGTASAGSTLLLTLVTTNAAGSSTATATVAVDAPASTPTISVPAAATDPSFNPSSPRVYTATLTPGAVAGVSYRWTVSGGLSCSPDGTLCGIAVANGTDPTTGTFMYTVNAAVGTTLSFAALAIDAAGDASATSNVAMQLVVPGPNAPTIATTYTIPNDPTSSTYTAFAPLKTYKLSVVTPHAGMTYRWTVNGVACTGAPSGTAPCTDVDSGHTGSSVDVTIDSSVGSPAAGTQIAISVAEVNAAGDSAPSTARSVSVMSPPAAPVIGVVDHNMNVLDGTAAHPYALTQNQQATPYVDSASGLHYFWIAVGSTPDTPNLIDPASSPAGTAGTDPVTPSTPTNQVLINGPVYTAGELAKLTVYAVNAATYTLSAERDLTIEPSPMATIDVPALDNDVRDPKSITEGAQNVAGQVTAPANADGTAMSTSCTSDSNASIVTNADASGSFTFSTDAVPSGSTTTLTCTATNAAGDSATGMLEIPLGAPLTVTALTPASGTVPDTTIATITFSYPPDLATLLDAADCSGSVVLFNNADSGTCPAVTITQDMSNKSLFSVTPTAPLIDGATYTFRVSKNAAAPVKDLQGVALAAGRTVTFTIATATNPIPDVTGVTAVPHLQSLSVSWTNPVDASLNHVHVVAVPTSGTTVSVDTTTPLQQSIDVGPLLPNTSYTVTAFVSNSMGDSPHSNGASAAAQTTGLTGQAADFFSTQTLTGLGPAFNGANAASFSLTWDATNLYIGFEQAGASAPALQDGDALWIGVDIEGQGSDTHGNPFSPLGPGNAEILWPFNADYVIELKLSADGSSLTADVIDVTANSSTPINNPVMLNGTLAELQLPATALSLDGSTAPSKLRFAMAYLSLTQATNSDMQPGTVFDLAPASFSATTTDGHTPATDVLGSLASITNCVDAASPLSNTSAPTSVSGSTHEPAPALVTFNLSDASAAATDTLQISAYAAGATDFPPLSTVLSDSSYALADDGTRGSTANGSGSYTGVFNFGAFAAPNPGFGILLFKFADTTVGPTPVTTLEPKFTAGHDRVFTLSGSNDSVGTSTDPIVYNAVYSATHDFELDFHVTGTTDPFISVDLIGSEGALALANDGNGLSMTANTAIPSTDWSATVPFTGGDDFVSGNGNCHGADGSGTPDPSGCPLVFYGSGMATDGVEPETGARHTMNDDVINKRLLQWTWADGSSF